VSDEELLAPPHRKWLAIARIVVGVLSGLITAGGIAFAIALKLASGTFVTRDELAREKVTILREIETRMDVDRQVTNQRIEGLAEKIDGLGKTTHSDNERMQNSIDRILNILLTRGR
jgi:hypothetical protein